MATRPERIDDPHAVLLALLRGNFGAFLRKAFTTVSGQGPLLWNWHHDAIVHQLDQVRRGACHRLLVTMPPRNLKSIAITVAWVAWVAWMLGRDPTLNFVCVSYSNDLAGSHARDCLRIMETAWYRELFPGTLISSKRSAAGDFETTRGGGRLATSVTGTLTGRGGEIIIVDDPVKASEAHSEVVREGVNGWFRSTLPSRLNNKSDGAIIVVMQRLHQHDLAGMLFEQGGWTALSLPAIAMEEELVPLTRGRLFRRAMGDILHPAHESAAVLAQQRLDMGSTDFDAQYQQMPVAASGNIIQAAWLRTTPPGFDPTASGQIVQSYDTANKDNPSADWSVCITAHVHRRQVHILHVFRVKLPLPELRRQAYRLAHEHRAQTILIEDQASGTQLIQMFRDEQPAGLPQPIACRPEADKTSRLMGISAQIEAGELSLPADAPWLGEFRAEILGRPHTRHDDQADALAQLMSWVARNAARADTPLVGPISVGLDEWGTSRSTEPSPPATTNWPVASSAWSTSPPLDTGSNLSTPPRPRFIGSMRLLVVKLRELIIRNRLHARRSPRCQRVFLNRLSIV